MSSSGVRAEVVIRWEEEDISVGTPQSQWSHQRQQTEYLKDLFLVRGGWTLDTILIYIFLDKLGNLNKHPEVGKKFIPGTHNLFF